MATRQVGQVVFFEESGRWIAHHVEMDLLGDGATREEALAALMRTVMIQAELSIEYKNPCNLFNPLPPELQLKLSVGEPVEVNGYAGLLCADPYAEGIPE